LRAAAVRGFETVVLSAIKISALTEIGGRLFELPERLVQPVAELQACDLVDRCQCHCVAYDTHLERKRNVH
jgi:hypothetical protein